MDILTGKKLLIFDCDGVLFDSHDANIAYFNRCLSIGGYPELNDDISKKVVFMSVRQLLREIVSTEEEVERVFQISQNVEYSEFIPRLIPLFDFEKTFTLLKQNYLLSVATNRGRSLNRLFHYYDFFNYFSYKITAMDAKSKPDPDMLNKTLEYFALPAANALFIGDSDSDMKSAAAAGIDFLRIGSSEGYTGLSINNVSDIINE
jgi:HAD superfamily hydrolase (TIGR01549 family)